MCYDAWSKWGIAWTGYLVPARDGSGLLPDWESSWDVVAAVAAAVTWKFRLTFRPGNYIWSFQIEFWLIWELSEFWDRGSTQNFEPDWSSILIGLGTSLVFPKMTCSFFFGKFGNVSFWQNIQNVQMTISTISTYPKLKLSRKSKIN